MATAMFPLITVLCQQTPFACSLTSCTIFITSSVLNVGPTNLTCWGCTPSLVLGKQPSWSTSIHERRSSSAERSSAGWGSASSSVFGGRPIARRVWTWALFGNVDDTQDANGRQGALSRK